MARGNYGFSEVRLGPIRWGVRGRGAAWAQFPLAAANAAAREAELALGWLATMVETLGGRPHQCHRCWFGYTRAACSGSFTDR